MQTEYNNEALDKLKKVLGGFNTKKDDKVDTLRKKKKKKKKKTLEWKNIMCHLGFPFQRTNTFRRYTNAGLYIHFFFFLRKGKITFKIK